MAIAESQVGYATNPSNSYCNKSSAHWNAGTADCPSGEKSEEWCADFAAWAWQKAGAPFTYGYGSGDQRRCRQLLCVGGRQRRVAPGDVAVYGLSLGADPSVVHVAIVTNDAPGRSGPDVVNGEGDRTGYSLVETGTDQAIADASNGDSTLAGYVSPP